jgi:hypothetical protein
MICCNYFFWGFQGKEVIDFYINELLSEGITYIPPWSADSISKPALPASETETMSNAEGTSDLEKTIRPSPEAASVPTETPPSPASSRQRSESLSSRSSLMLGASAANISVPDVEGVLSMPCYL